MITAVLRNRFIHPFRPVLLSSLIRRFDGIEHSFRFYELVNEYLPEEKENLINLVPDDAVRVFTKDFTKKYFKIINVSSYGNAFEVLTRRIPLDWHGLYERYYNNTWHMTDSHLLAASVCECPFGDIPLDEEDENGTSGGARLSIVDKLTQRCEQAAKMLTKNGYTFRQVEGVLKDSPYKNFLIWCQWIFSQTGNRWLDTGSEMGCPDWTRENVDSLTADWPEYNRLQAGMDEFEKWLKKDFQTRSVEVIQHINDSIKKTLYHVFTGGDNGKEEIR
jgi:hypothetical protein